MDFSALCRELGPVTCLSTFLSIAIHEFGKATHLPMFSTDWWSAVEQVRMSNPYVDLLAFAMPDLTTPSAAIKRCGPMVALLKHQMTYLFVRMLLSTPC